MTPYLDVAEAEDVVVASTLFEKQWYAARCGRSFGSRAEAVRHWVTTAATDEARHTTPHPLFEPAWLYPRGRWRKQAPDPLSFWLTRPQEQRRSPHPLVDLDRTGPLDAWLRDHRATELLPRPVERDPLAEVSVEVEVGALPRAVQWARHLATTYPSITAQLVTDDPTAARVLTAVAATLPSVWVVQESQPTEIVVRVRANVRPPRGEWLTDLIDAVRRPGVAWAEPLLLDEGYTVKGPFLAGHPVADVERMAHLGLPTPQLDVAARRPGGSGGLVLVPSSRLVADPAERPPEAAAPPEPADVDLRWRAAGFDGPHGRPLTVREGRRALRWSIDIAAPAWGVRWGDWHFAHSLKDALERLGQWVAVDHPQTRGRGTRELDDVVLVLRGLDRVTPPAHTTNLLWVISHPELVDEQEARQYDAVWAASTTWSIDRSRDWGVPVETLLQCTDPTRFHPGLAEPDSGPATLFVGNSRGELRASVAAALATGLDLTVIGHGWPDHVPVEAGHVANDELGRLYASAGLVLNDHWADMRDQGFVSNRVFDVLATGGRLLSDDVAGLHGVIGPEVVPTWRTLEDFRRLTTGDRDAHWPGAGQRRRTAERVMAAHGFDARAATLLDRALSVVERS